MFYAIRVQQVGTARQVQGLSFYKKSTRDMFVAEHGNTRAVSCHEFRALSFAGPSRSHRTQQGAVFHVRPIMAEGQGGGDAWRS